MTNVSVLPGLLCLPRGSAVTLKSRLAQYLASGSAATADDMLPAYEEQNTFSRVARPRAYVRPDLQRTSRHPPIAICASVLLPLISDASIFLCPQAPKRTLQ